MECLGSHNKPQAEVLPGHKLTGPKEEEEEEEEKEKKKEEEEKKKNLCANCTQRINSGYCQSY
jgi:hypothetical protein